MFSSFAMVSQSESSHDRVDDCVSARETSASAFVVRNQRECVCRACSVSRAETHSCSPHIKWIKISRMKKRSTATSNCGEQAGKEVNLPFKRLT